MVLRFEFSNLVYTHIIFSSVTSTKSIHIFIILQLDSHILISKHSKATQTHTYIHKNYTISNIKNINKKLQQKNGEKVGFFSITDAITCIKLA